MTGRGSESAAVEALKAGAFHYLTKPVNPEELASLIRQAVQKFAMATEIAQLHERLNEQHQFRNMIGKTAAMRKVFEQIRMAADTRSNILIQGESGTGKELVARALHADSSRSNAPFVAVNCSAIPEALIESELFGHVKGAFTGATVARHGRFKAANGGSLLIDEIGELALDLQSKLLRAVESRVISPVGADQEVPIDVRLIAATHRDLESLVKEKLFREDLFYRLNVVRINIPPLRDRKEDIPLLAQAFLEELAAETHREVREISPDALALLQGYSWPGNVRQLRNVLEGIIVMCPRSSIEVTDLPEIVRGARPAFSVAQLVDSGMTMEEIERKAIEHALKLAAGSRTRSSEILGISIRTLQRKIAKYGMS
jgi:two-component system response regulator HydG